MVRSDRACRAVNSRNGQIRLRHKGTRQCGFCKAGIVANCACSTCNVRRTSDVPMSKPRVTPSTRLHPHLVVVEGRAAIGRDRIRAGQRVDAAAVLEGCVAARSIPRSARRGARRRTACACSRTSPRRCRARPCRRRRCARSAASSGWIITVGRPSLRARGRRLVEGRVEEVARRRGRQAERMLAVGLLDHLPMVRQRSACRRPVRHARGCGTARSASPA